MAGARILASPKVWAYIICVALVAGGCGGAEPFDLRTSEGATPAPVTPYVAAAPATPTPDVAPTVEVPEAGRVIEDSVDTASSFDSPVASLPVTASTSRLLAAQGGQINAIKLIDLGAREVITVPRVGGFEAVAPGGTSIWYVDLDYNVRSVGWDGVEQFSADVLQGLWYRYVLPLADDGVAIVDSPDGSEPVTLSTYDASGDQRCSVLMDGSPGLRAQGDELWSSREERFSTNSCELVGDLPPVWVYERWPVSESEIYTNEYSEDGGSLGRWQLTDMGWTVSSITPIGNGLGSVFSDGTSLWLTADTDEYLGSRLVHVSRTDHQVIGSWPLFDCNHRPQIVAVDTYVWVVNDGTDPEGCDDKIARFDPSTGEVERYRLLSEFGFDTSVGPDGLWFNHLDEDFGPYFFSFDRLRLERLPEGLVGEDFWAYALAVDNTSD